MHLEGMKLYMMTSCPYCQRVLHFLDRHELTIDLVDTTQPGNLDELERIGGKRQVPCLVVDGKPMYESTDIVAYLKALTAES